MLERPFEMLSHGMNGSGKTSLLKLLLGQPLDHGGVYSLGAGLVHSYVPRDTSHLKGSLSEFAEDCVKKCPWQLTNRPEPDILVTSKDFDVR